MKQPNIVLITIESMDGRVLGALDYPGAVTPNMDSIAERGTVFANAYCPTPICNPSRASLWTGKHPHRINGWDNTTGLLQGQPELGQYFADAGYRIGDMGRRDRTAGRHAPDRLLCWTRAAEIDLPYNPPHRRSVVDGPLWRTWDLNNLTGSNGPAWNASVPFLEWIEDAGNDDRPFFAHFGLGGVHTGSGYHAASEQLARIDPDAVRLPPWEEITHPVLRFQAVTKNRDHHPDDEEILASQRHYYADIAEIDDYVGLVLRKLGDLGLDDSTWVFVLSDHGDMQMEHGGQYAKMNFYDASSRVVLLARGPDGSPGQRIDEPVSLIDVCPTVCELAGLPLPDDLDGHSLAAALRGEEDTHPHRVAGQFHGCWAQTSMFMWRHGPWKLVEYPGFDPQLFHLETDPDEMNDLSDSHPEQVETLARQLRAELDVESLAQTSMHRNHEDFVRWRATLSRDQYEQQITETFGRYQPLEDRHWQSLETWANTGP